MSEKLTLFVCHIDEGGPPPHACKRTQHHRLGSRSRARPDGHVVITESQPPLRFPYTVRIVCSRSHTAHGG